MTKNVNMKKIYCVICGKYRKSKNPKISNIFESGKIKMKKHLNKKNQLKYKKFLV